MEEVNLKEVEKRLYDYICAIGVNLKRIRLEKGITQQTLAFCILTDKCVISNLERGTTHGITLFTLLKIANVLDVKLEDLIN